MSIYPPAGPLMAFPVQDVSVSVTSLSLGSVTSLSSLSACVANGVSVALKEADVQVCNTILQLYAYPSFYLFHDICQKQT